MTEEGADARDLPCVLSAVANLVGVFFFGVVGEGDVFEVDDGVAEARWRWDEEVHFSFFDGGVLVFDFVEGIEAGAGFGGAGFDAGADPFEFFFEEFLALLFGVFGDALADRFGLKEGGVVPGVGVGLAIRDLDDAGGDDVEEVAVVGDEDDGSFVGF